MESPSFVQTLQNENWRFGTATTIEDVLCLAVFMAKSNEVNFGIGTVNKAREQWAGPFHGDCKECPWDKECLASIINE